MNRIKFKEFVTLQRGFDLPRSQMVEGEYPVVGSTSIIGFHNEYKREPPGVVTGRSGSLGIVQYITSKYWPHNTSLWVKDFKGNLPRYVYYLLKTLPLANYNAGAGVPTLNRNHLDNLDIKTHDLVDQHKVSAILSAYDDLIENNTRRIQILEEMAQRIYREWFLDFRFPGHEKVKFVDSEMGKIPEGWHVGKFAEIVEFQSGFAFKSSTFNENGNYGLVTIKNVQDGFFISECQSRLMEFPSKMPDYCHLSTGDILLSLTGNIGRVCIVYGENYLLNQRVAKLKPLMNHDRAFIYFRFRDSESQNKLEMISTGVAQQNLSPVEAGQMLCVIPSDQIRREFSSFCNPFVDEIINFYLRNLNLRKTRDLLLPKLISGEIDVSGMDVVMQEIGC